jgi:hypothetical protein
MEVVPAATPVTTPEAEPMVATAGLALVQLPPVTVSASVIIAPTHSVLLPEMGDGAGFTVTVL